MVMMNEKIMVNTEPLSVYLDNSFKFSVDYNGDRRFFSHHMVSGWKSWLSHMEVAVNTHVSNEQFLTAKKEYSSLHFGQHGSQLFFVNTSKLQNITQDLEIDQILWN
jgi:hypothetical protein